MYNNQPIARKQSNSSKTAKKRHFIHDGSFQHSLIWLPVELPGVLQHFVQLGRLSEKKISN